MATIAVSTTGKPLPRQPPYFSHTPSPGSPRWDANEDHGVTNYTKPVPQDDTEYLTDSFDRFIAARDGNPFMAQVSFHNCHVSSESSSLLLQSPADSRLPIHDRSPTSGPLRRERTALPARPANRAATAMPSSTFTLA